MTRAVVVGLILAFLLFTSTGQTIGLFGLIWGAYELGLLQPTHVDAAQEAATRQAEQSPGRPPSRKSSG
jgi:hypothetical protein